LNFRYGRKNIFNNFNIKIHQSEFFGIIGPNGSGKSTLLRIILGLLKAKSGLIYVADHDVKRISRKHLAQKLSAVMQEFSPTYDFSVEEIIYMGRTPYYGLFSGKSLKDKEIVDSAIAETDLQGFEKRKYHTLSGGEKQRVLIAKCFAQTTPVVLLDEFVAHLDPGHVQNLMQRMHNKNKKDGITCLLYTSPSPRDVEESRMPSSA